MTDVVVAQHLGKTFRANGRVVEAVRDLSLAVRKGELFGLFGHNGAGKSTLVRMLATLVRPNSGSARVNGFDVVRAERQVRASIGLVASDERSFYGRLSARDNLRFFAALQNVPRASVDERVRAVLDLFNLADIAARPVQTYSTGQKQRLNLARALLHDPPILFLDEPTKSMDVQTSDFVKSLVKQELVARRGKTVVFISHELYEMEDFCDHLAVIAHGELRARGTPRELLQQLPDQPVFQLKVEGLPEAVIADVQRVGALAHLSVARTNGTTTLEFTVMESASDWQAALWQSMLGHGGHITEFRQLHGRTLRDVIRYFSADV